MKEFSKLQALAEAAGSILTPDARASESRRRKFFTQLENSMENVAINVHSKVLKDILVQGKFPETESKDMIAAYDKFSREVDDLKQALLSEFMNEAKTATIKKATDPKKVKQHETKKDATKIANKGGKSLTALAPEMDGVDASKTMKAKTRETVKVTPQTDKFGKKTSTFGKKVVKEAGPDSMPKKSDISKLLNNAEDGLRDEVGDQVRYKRFDVDMENKTVQWFTQESNPGDDKLAAKWVANLMGKNGYKGWTIKFTVRDNDRGEDTKFTGTAKS